MDLREIIFIGVMGFSGLLLLFFWGNRQAISRLKVDFKNLFSMDLEAGSLRGGSAYGSLTEHAFFDRMRQYIRQTTTLKFQDPDKRAVVTAFLSLIFSAFRDWMLEYVAAKEQAGSYRVDDLTDRFQVWLQEARSMLKTIIIRFQDNSLMEGVPACFVTNFNREYLYHLRMAEEKIVEIKNNELYRCEREKLLAMLEVIDMAWYQVLLDAKRAADQLNGDLEDAIRRHKKGEYLNAKTNL